MLPKFFTLAAVLTTVSPVFAAFTNPTSTTRYNRGDGVPIEWKYDNTHEAVNIRFVPGTVSGIEKPGEAKWPVVIFVVDNWPYQTGIFRWSIPPKLIEVKEWPTWRFVMIHPQRPDVWEYSEAFPVDPYVEHHPVQLLAASA